MDLEKDPTLAEQEKEASLLWEYLEEGEYDYQQPQRGDIRAGTIIRKDTDQIIVDIGAKREGIVPASDLEKLGPEAVAELEVGDELPVYVLSPEGKDGDVIVSINMARQIADWDRAEELLGTGEVIEKKVTGFNKGGLLVQCGHLQGFIPRSHIVNLEGRTKPGAPQERLSQMVGEEIPLKVIEVNRRQRRLILSERAAWQEWRAEQKKHLLESIEVGDVRKGTVSSLADFGAFVDLGGADGLIHISELSWDHGKRPSDVVQIGDEIEVKVIRVDPERQRIGLSLKQLKPDPWETIEERYVIGQYVDAKVTNLTKFGAFARLEEGVEGLIHISELAEHNVQHPGEVVQPGQTLTVQIISLEPQRKRVGLSIRRVPDHLRMPIETEAEGTEEPPRPEELWESEEVEAGSADETGMPAMPVAEASVEAANEADETIAGETEAIADAGYLDVEQEEPVAEIPASVDSSTDEPAGDQQIEGLSTPAGVNGDKSAEKQAEESPAGESSRVMRDK